MYDLIYYDFNHKSSILLIFFAHAMIFSFLLLRNGILEDKKHSKWLALFIFLGGLYICPFMLGYANWYAVKDYREFLFFMPLQQLFLLGPVFYFYVKTLLNTNTKLTQQDLIHFLPALLYLIYSLIVFVTDKIVLDEYYFYADGKDKDLDFWYQMAGLVSMLLYLLMSLVHYDRYRKAAVEEVSFADQIAHTWIKHFAVAFSLILILRVFFFILNPEWGQFGSKYWYYLCFAVLMLYISVAGYTHTIRSTSLFDFEPLYTDNSKYPSYEVTDAISTHNWKAKIEQLFDERKIYEDPNLTLTSVADLLQTNRNVISKVINQEFQMNFNDFVNKKRTEAIIRKFENGDHIQNTLVAIALDSGFNSKTTFNRAFKKHTGLAARQYIAENGL